MSKDRKVNTTGSTSSTVVRKNEHMFGKVSMSPLAQELLLYLARSPGREYYVRELAELLNASLGGSHAALKGLESRALVTSRMSGRNRYFQVNEGNASIVPFKVFMNIQELGEVVAPLRDLVRRVILFGSCSRGDDTHASDVDLLVVTLDVEEVRLLLGSTKVNGRVLRPIIKTPSEMVRLREEDPSFIAELGKGIVLIRGGMDG
jgi:predicted nucleotidyltransferase